MKLHLPSVLVSLGVAGAFALLTSQSQPATLNPASIRIEYVPHPRDMVQIREESGPYTVPAGKLFVLTGLGLSDDVGFTTLHMNGVSEVAMQTSCSNGGGPTIAAAPLGFTAPAGAVLSVDGEGTHLSRAWGYIASQ